MSDTRNSSDPAPVAAELLPRCESLDGSTLQIVPAYTEAGYFCEANVLTVTDGERTAIYVPFAVVPAVSVGDRVACRCPGSWTDGKEGTVLKLNVVSSDGIHGHLLQMETGVTVLPPYELRVLNPEPATATE